MKIVCFSRQKEVSGKTRALIIRALAPFFTVNSVQEGAAMLIATVPRTELSSLKVGLDVTSSEDDPSFEGIASNLICRSLHQLVFKLFKPVPIKLLKPEIQNLSLSRYISNDSVYPQINLGIHSFLLSPLFPFPFLLFPSPSLYYLLFPFPFSPFPPFPFFYFLTSLVVRGKSHSFRLLPLSLASSLPTPLSLLKCSCSPSSFPL